MLSLHAYIHKGFILKFMRLRIFLWLYIMVVSLSVRAQENNVNNVNSMLETGRQYMRSGDFSNAVMIFNKALADAPNHLELLKELAMTYYLQRDFAKAKETIKPLLDREDADVQVFQIAGNIYKALEELKECERMYRKGIRLHPNAGPLYAEYGDLLWKQKDFSAIQQWEAGIRNDPNYPANYYHAAKHYYFSTDKVWSIIYGEIFINMESYSNRTAEMKNLLLEAYKKLFTPANRNTNSRIKGEFAEAVYKTWMQNSQIMSGGVTTDHLIMLRTRFLLEWDKTYASRFPHRLFDLHRQLLQQGMFEAYNHWIFTAAGNLAAFDAWTKTHAEAYNAFSKFQRSRVFKMAAGQYYQSN